MRNIALVYQPRVTEALPLAQACAAALTARGLHSTIFSVAEIEPGRAPPDCDLVVTFGGDGTILHAGGWLNGKEVPIVGVQMGRLGFLAELMPSDLPQALEPYLDGDFWNDRRAMLAATVAPPGSSQGDDKAAQRLLALNDVVAARGAFPRTVTVDVSINDDLLRSFRCDGMIVATATGSTAYSFAAGGPVLSPEARDIVVTAICPHNSDLHSLVLPGSSRLQLQIWTTEQAVLSVDGQIDVPLENGTVIKAGLSDCVTTFARRGSHADFYRRVMAKLH